MKTNRFSFLLQERMKTQQHFAKNPILAVFALFLAVAGGRADTPIFTFSGGNGTPLTLSLDASLVFTLTNVAANKQYILDIRDAYTSTPGSASANFSVGSGVPTLSYNNTTNNIQTIYAGQGPFAAVAATDLLLTFSVPVVTLTNGTTITINPGTATTSGSWLKSLPNSPGTKSVYIVDFSSGQQRSPALQAIIAIAVPEPSTWAMIGAGVLGLLATRRRRA